MNETLRHLEIRITMSWATNRHLVQGIAVAKRAVPKKSSKRMDAQDLTLTEMHPARRFRPIQPEEHRTIHFTQFWANFPGVHRWRTERCRTTSTGPDAVQPSGTQEIETCLWGTPI